MNPKAELKRLLPEHQQISGARKIAPIIDIENNPLGPGAFYIRRRDGRQWKARYQAFLEEHRRKKLLLRLLEGFQV